MATVFHAQVMHRTDESARVPDVQLAFGSFAATREVERNGAMKIAPAREAGFLVSTLFQHPRAT